MIETIGWIGSTMLAICGLPQVIHTIGLGCAKGLSWWFLGLWGGGEILCSIYTYLQLGWDPLHFNYGINMLFISIMIYYKYRR